IARKGEVSAQTPQSKVEGEHTADDGNVSFAMRAERPREPRTELWQHPKRRRGNERARDGRPRAATVESFAHLPGKLPRQERNQQQRGCDVKTPRNTEVLVLLPPTQQVEDGEGDRPRRPAR